MSEEIDYSKEEWKAIVGFEGLYSVSNLGRIRRETSTNNWHPVGVTNPGTDKDGYKMARLTKNGKSIKRRVHRLVLEAFIGLDPQRLQCNHKNGIKGENKLINLEWVDASENQLHSIYVLGNTILNQGERNGNAKLAESQVREIRRMFSSGVRPSQIARQVGTSQRNVYDIVKRRRWAHI